MKNGQNDNNMWIWIKGMWVFLVLSLQLFISVKLLPNKQFWKRGCLRLVWGMAWEAVCFVLQVLLSGLEPDVAWILLCKDCDFQQFSFLCPIFLCTGQGDGRVLHSLGLYFCFRKSWSEVSEASGKCSPRFFRKPWDAWHASDCPCCSVVPGSFIHAQPPQARQHLLLKIPGSAVQQRFPRELRWNGLFSSGSSY